MQMKLSETPFSTSSSMMFQDQGYVVKKNFFKSEELSRLEDILFGFHADWIKSHYDEYQGGLINSSGITESVSLNDTQKADLFNFISNRKLSGQLSKFIPNKPVFMGTQLFFDPYDKNKKNYWHRDTQYHLSLDEQKEALEGPQVLHFRIPLKNERGIELVPGSHKNWDTEEELDVRLEQDGKRQHDPLNNTRVIELERGDLLVFSANMIHRGIYGNDRFAFDILFCEFDKQLANFIQANALPDRGLMNHIQNAEVYIHSKMLKAFAT